MNQIMPYPLWIGHAGECRTFAEGRLPGTSKSLSNWHSESYPCNLPTN